MPAVVILRRDSNAERVTTVLPEHIFPVVNVEIDRLFSLAMQAVPVTVCYDRIDTRSLLICHTEVERSNVHGYSDPDVIGIDIRLSRLLLGIADSLCTCYHEKRGKEQEARGKKYM